MMSNRRSHLSMKKEEKTMINITRIRVSADRPDLIKVPFPKEILVDQKKEMAKKNQAAGADAWFDPAIYYSSSNEQQG